MSPEKKDAHYDSESTRRFDGLDLTADLHSDESTILRFRHLLEKCWLTEQLFAEVRALLGERNLPLKSGAILDATIIAAPPSTKNVSQGREIFGDQAYWSEDHSQHCPHAAI